LAEHSSAVEDTPPPQEDRAHQSAAPGSTELSGMLGEAGALLGKAVFGLARVVLRRGRQGARRAATSGRTLLDLRQLRHDKDAMYQKLGREVRHLVEGGEVDHPGLARGVERIRELEARIAEVEAQVAAQRAAEVAAAVARERQAREQQATGGGAQPEEEAPDAVPDAALPLGAEGETGEDPAQGASAGGPEFASQADDHAEAQRAVRPPAGRRSR